MWSDFILYARHLRSGDTVYFMDCNSRSTGVFKKYLIIGVLLYSPILYGTLHHLKSISCSLKSQGWIFNKFTLKKACLFCCLLLSKHGLNKLTNKIPLQLSAAVLYPNLMQIFHTVFFFLYSHPIIPTDAVKAPRINHRGAISGFKHADLCQPFASTPSGSSFCPRQIPMASWEEEVALLDNWVAGLLVKSPLSFAYVSRRTGKPFWEKTHWCCLLAEAFVGLDFLSRRLATRQVKRRPRPPYSTPEEAHLHSCPSIMSWMCKLRQAKKDLVCIQLWFLCIMIKLYLPVLTWLTLTSTHECNWAFMEMSPVVSIS